MTRWPLRAIGSLAPLVLLLGGLTPPALAQTNETLGEVRVHGNHTTPDADILAIAGLVVGGPVSDATIADATRRLETSGRFDSVELRKRYRSIDNPSDVLIIVLVDEVAGIADDDLTPGPLRRLRSRGMWLPILDYTDGYGFTYGARVTFADALGRRGRISIPLTWGGERRAAVELERAFARGPLSRIRASAALVRREHPFFEIGDTGRVLSVGADRAVTPWLRVEGGTSFANVRFGGVEQSFVAPRLGVVVDTRLNPGFPRNAVHLSAGVEQLRFQDGPRVTRTSNDLRGYLGLVGSSVLALRAVNVHASQPLPPFEQQIAGAGSTLRGYRVGYQVGDHLTALSAELRVPVTSPLSAGRFGVKAFWDASTVYASGRRLSDQRFDQGVGGGVFLSLAVVQLSIDAAWPVTTDARKPRWHVGLGLTF